MRAVALFAAALQAVAPTPAPTPAPVPDGVPAAAAVRGADLDLLRAVRRIADRVAALHGEAFDRAPIAVRASADVREAAAEIRVLNAVPRDRLAARGRAWEDLGLGSAGSPARIYAVLAADLDGVGFDPEGNRLLVDPGRLTEADFAPSKASDPASILMSTGVRPDEPLVGHVLTHVRQLERSGADWLGPTTDGTLARAAWAEAEANLLAMRYLFDGMGLADAAVGGGLEPAGVLDGRLVPALDGLGEAERELLRFVYGDGFDAAAAVFRDDGFAGVVRGAARRPTTRDVLHRGATPTPPAATDPAAGPPGFVLADEDVVGEHGVFVLISTLTGKDDLALQAADGWIGDRLLRFEPPAGAPATDAVTDWRTRWVDEAARADFEYALVRALESRFPGRTVTEAGPASRVLSGPDRVYRIERQATDLRLRVGPPEPTAAAGSPGRS